MAPSGAYVRFTTYDVRFGEFPRGARECGGAGAVVEMWSDVRGWLESGDGAWRRLCTMYDFRCTIWGVPARSASVVERVRWWKCGATGGGG